MRLSGELVQWNDRGGYGFVRDAAGRDYYVHISTISATGRPRIGDRLTFASGVGRNGRPSALDAVIAASEPAPRGLRDTRRLPAGAAQPVLGLRTATATMLTLLLIWAIASGHAPLWFGVLYAVMGAASALLYRFDKLYALTGKWRVRESNLQLLDLCFGIIGGLSAQEVYRHKTIKPRFVATTWGIALLHIVGVAALALGWLGNFVF